MYESIDLGVEFGGIFSEPTINNDNELRIELIKLLFKNEDIMNVITDEMLSLLDLRIIKYKNDPKVKDLDLRLVLLFVNFIEINKNLYKYRFPNYVLRYLDNRYQYLLKTEKSQSNFNNIPNDIDVNETKVTSPEIKVTSPETSSITYKKKLNSNVKKSKKKESVDEIDFKSKWERSIYPEKNNMETNINHLNIEKTNCLMIRNLNKKIKIEDIKKFLIEKNLILSKSHRNPINFAYNKSKKYRMDYAFITFCNESETAKAKNTLDGIYWNNCKLRVLNAKENF